MKFYLSLVAICFLCACQQQDQKETVCAKKSDLFYEGFNGKVKKIARKYSYSDDVVWNIEDAVYYSIRTSHYDEDGFRTKDIYQTFRNGKLISETITKVSGISYRLSEYIDQDGNRGIDSVIWINDSTERTATYTATNGQLVLESEGINVYDNDCMPFTAKKTIYDVLTGRVKDKEDYDYSKLPDSIKQLRKEYKNAFLYHGYYTVIEWDDHNNPVKILLSNDNGLRRVYVYEYYQ